MRLSAVLFSASVWAVFLGLAFHFTVIPALFVLAITATILAIGVCRS